MQKPSATARRITSQALVEEVDQRLLFSGTRAIHPDIGFSAYVIDGATAVRFLVTIKQMIEDPETLLIEG